MPSTGLTVPCNVSISREPHGGPLRQVFGPYFIFFLFLFFAYFGRGGVGRGGWVLVWFWFCLLVPGVGPQASQTLGSVPNL